MGKEMQKTLYYNGYSAIILDSPEDQIFYGKVDLKTDVVSFEGKTITELEQAFREAIDSYLEICKEAGKDS